MTGGALLCARYLQNNALESLEGLERLPELEVLNVSNNRLTHLDPLSRCTKLATFLGAENELSDVGSIDSITHCKLLATVDLQDNELSDAQVTPTVASACPLLDHCECGTRTEQQSLVIVTWTARGLQTYACPELLASVVWCRCWTAWRRCLTSAACT